MQQKFVANKKTNKINTDYPPYRLCSLEEECFNAFASSCLFGCVSFILNHSSTLTDMQHFTNNTQYSISKKK